VAGEILLVDDEWYKGCNLEQQILESLKGAEGIGEIKLVGATNKDGALKILEKEMIHLVLLDLKGKDYNFGIEILKEVKSRYKVPVIMLTAYYDFSELPHEVVTKILEGGLYDYVAKGNPIRLRLAARNALDTYKNQLKIIQNQDLIPEIREMIELCKKLNPNVYQTYKLYRSEKDEKYDIIAASRGMEEAWKDIKDAADVDFEVLILGERGTGKELVARAIHEQSSYRRNNSRRRIKEVFISVDCPAIPDTLFESEIFGYKKGAFSGADRDKKGKLELANKGTIFLDEVGDLSPSAQVKLLRFLQEGEFYSVGAEKPTKVDVRVIAATNRNLRKKIKNGHFRADFLDRLKKIVIRVPPLRERRKDIPLLFNYFIQISPAC